MADFAHLHLRSAVTQDKDELHDLFCLPEVYRYLADGAPPPESVTKDWIQRSSEDGAKAAGVGLLVLSASNEPVLGCVRTHLLSTPGTIELSYVLHPRLWGQGIATAMAWTAIQRAFEGGDIDCVMAETDDPNTASLAVMKRLGMTFRRKTQNPKWSSVEYMRRVDDSPPQVLPDILPIR